MKTYNVKINGIDHTLQLEEEDAKRMGVTEGGELGTPPATTEEDTDTTTKSGKPANKARS